MLLNEISFETFHSKNIENQIKIFKTFQKALQNKEFHATSRGQLQIKALGK